MRNRYEVRFMGDVMMREEIMAGGWYVDNDNGVLHFFNVNPNSTDVNNDTVMSYTLHSVIAWAILPQTQ